MKTCNKKMSLLTFLLLNSFFSSAALAQNDPQYVYKKRVEQLVIKNSATPPVSSPALFALSTDLLDLGEGLAESILTKSILIQNQGTSSLTISSITAQGGGFTALHSCGTLLPGSVCAVNVSATSFSAADLTGTLSVNVGTDAKSATIKAKFLKAGVSLDKNSVQFGGLFTNTIYTDTVQVSNTGNSNLLISNIRSTDPRFSASGSCSQISPGMSCAVTITSQSTEPGQAQGSINISTNVGEYSVNTLATFEDPVISFGPKAGSSLTFATTGAGGSSQIVLEVKNLSTLPLNNISIIENIADVNISQNTCSGPLNPDQACNVTLTWSPTAGTDVSGSVGFASEELSATIAVNGTFSKSQAALQSGTLVLGDVPQYSVKNTTLTFKNTGNLPMTLTGLSGLPSAMSVTANNCSAIASGASCQMTVALSTATEAIQNVANVATEGATKNATFNVSYNVVNTYSSCGQILGANPAAVSGTYVIDPDGSGGLGAIGVYCDMATADGGPWMLAARIISGSTAHSNTGAVGVLTSPSQATAAKLSDEYINAFVKSHFYLKADQGFKSFFQYGNVPFSAIGTAASRYSSNAYSGSNYNKYTTPAAHGGLNTYGSSSSQQIYGLVYGDAGANSTCRKGMAVNSMYPWCGDGVSGAMWIK